MSRVKISGLPDARPIEGTEFVPVVQGGATKKTTPLELAKFDATTSLPTAATITGDAIVRIIQDGKPVQATVTDLAASGLFGSPSDGGGGGDSGGSNPGGGTSPSPSKPTETYQRVSDTGNITLPSYEDGHIYWVTLEQNTLITLPDVAALPNDQVLTVTVRVEQTGAHTLGWAAQNGGAVFWDEPKWAIPGPNKTSIFSFVIFGGDTNWLASLVWTQS